MVEPLDPPTLDALRERFAAYDIEASAEPRKSDGAYECYITVGGQRLGSAVERGWFGNSPEAKLAAYWNAGIQRTLADLGKVSP